MKTKRKTTPLKTIRQYCLWCCDNQPKEVRECPRGECPLYNFRFGRKNPLAGKTLKAIKARCLDCGEGTAQAVNKCEFPECELFPYRNGKNPARKGICNNTSKLIINLKKRTLSSEKIANEGL